VWIRIPRWPPYAPLPQLARGRRLKPDVCLVQIQDGALFKIKHGKRTVWPPKRDKSALTLSQLLERRSESWTG